MGENLIRSCKTGLHGFILVIVTLAFLFQSSCMTTKSSVSGGLGLLLTHAVVLRGEGLEPSLDSTILVTDGRIQFIGDESEARRLAPGAERVDLRGATVLPGLVDAHAHVSGLGMALETVSLVDTTSYAEVLDRIKAGAARAAKGEWITGRGWDQNDWASKDFPTSDELDRIVSDHPVWVTRIDGHAALANSAAMRAAGITASTTDPVGGKILRDDRGQPTGVFVDAAKDLVERVIPSPSREVQKRRLVRAAEEIAAHGLTGVHDAGVDDLTLSLMRELVDEGRLPIRIYAMLSDDDALLTKWFAKGPLIDYGGKLTVRSVKLYADGALGSRGAALLQPYADDASNSGLLLTSVEHIREVAARGRKAGFQVNTHAIGDRAVRNVLDAYESTSVNANDRFRIEHFQVSSLDDISRLAPRGIIASMQPTHATSDMYWAEQRVGPERIRGAYSWRTVLSRGGRLALGSDFPVEEVNPFFGIYAAVTRQDQKGWPSGGWYPSERLTIQEAIRGFSADAAYAAFEEQRRGTIDVGKAADFTIVESNPLTADPSLLFKTKVLYTVVGGKIVYKAR